MRCIRLGGILIVTVLMMPLVGAPANGGTRCGIYAGVYRCYGTSGGTGGRIFRKMEYNSRRCGYFNPGCYPAARRTYYHAPRRSYRWPIYGGYLRPHVGSGFVRPRVGAGYVRPR